VVDLVRLGPDSQVWAIDASAASIARPKGTQYLLLLAVGGRRHLALAVQRRGRTARLKTLKRPREIGWCEPDRPRRDPKGPTPRGQLRLPGRGLRRPLP
jgi:hypothetical protein